MKISFKGSLRAALYVYCYLEKQFYVFSNSTRCCLQADVRIEYVTSPVLLTESVFMYETFHYLKNYSKLVKNIIGNVVSIYQGNLAIEVPNVTEN